MKRYLLALLLFVGWTQIGHAQQPIYNPINCGQTAVYDASTNGKTQLVPAVAGRTTYVCGYTVFAAGTVAVSLTSGTGTNCGTTSANITPAYQLTTQTGVVDGTDIVRGLKTNSGEELCISTSLGVAVQAIVYYAQF